MQPVVLSCHMGPSFLTENEKDVYRFLALIQDSKGEKVWMKTESTLTELHGSCNHLVTSCP